MATSRYRTIAYIGCLGLMVLGSALCTFLFSVAIEVLRTPFVWSWNALTKLVVACIKPISLLRPAYRASYATNGASFR